jgi:predicted DNA-binding protein YlxM (UPF0122 family)
MLSEMQVRKIVVLLASTDMTVAEIATRMACSRSAVLSINRRHAVRDYAGCRSRWTVAVPETPR